MVLIRADRPFWRDSDAINGMWEDSKDLGKEKELQADAHNPFAKIKFRVRYVLMLCESQIMMIPID